MPILTIECVCDTSEPGPQSNQIHALADSLGDLFDSPAGGTWIKLRCLPREHYAENFITADTTIRSTFVTVIHRVLPGEAQLAIQAQEIATRVAKELQRPVPNVHVIFEPAGAGRVAFGGVLIRTDHRQS